MLLQIVNGPNLAKIGRREPEIYGNKSFDDYLLELKSYMPGHDIRYYQSNHEGDLIDALYNAQEDGVQGIVLNAGAYTHTSIALLDAIKAIAIPVVEVHISGVYGRETFRHTSMIAPACAGVIAGFGLDSYRLGIEALLLKLSV
ncbi:type II 3-dehydroquinate dehydratase [Porphyromonas pogonae]|uniref:type II 3-dehydroquinate dehydratase n=1 Tax=Porphyromonas pogonae TaxID=867595 RepID=UPI002E774AD3|nr:type II 3-dehydroquinate dehydratase [Porphyromonas pogonae]